MRISAKAKEETRQRILTAARYLFRRKGYDVATTREIARRAKIASGTLFNYFPNKEAIVLHLAREASRQVAGEFRPTLPTHETLAEALFAHVALLLRKLEPLRGFLYPALGMALSPAAAPGDSLDADAIREEHLATVSSILAEAGILDATDPVSLHLYWTLFTGVVAFWVRDGSPHQEDTRALLDRSITLFATSLDPDAEGDP